MNEDPCIKCPSQIKNSRQCYDSKCAIKIIYDRKLHDQQIRAQVLEEARQAALSATVQEFKDNAYVYRIDAFKFDGLLAELKGDVGK